VNCASTKDEIRYTPEGFEVHLGQVVWSRKRYWSAVRGSLVKEKYGEYSGYEGCPQELTLRHARRDWSCADCGHKIYRDDMHGSTYYDHYCLDCITPTRPENWFEDKPQ